MMEEIFSKYYLTEKAGITWLGFIIFLYVSTIIYIVVRIRRQSQIISKKKQAGRKFEMPVFLRFCIIQFLPLVFSTSALISLLWQDYEDFGGFVTNTLEAIAVGFYLNIIIWRLGGRGALIYYFAHQAKLKVQTISVVKRLGTMDQLEEDNYDDYCEYNQLVENRFVPLYIEIGVWQFAILRPTFEVIQIILVKQNLFSKGSLSPSEPLIYLKVGGFITAIFAFGVISALYMKTRYHESMRGFQLQLKLLAVKLCAFLSAFQSMLFDFLLNHKYLNLRERIFMEQTITIIEMVPVCVVVSYAFDLSKLL